MSKEINRLDCEIVEDLLPLYHDGVVNVVTSEAVEEHLKECEMCKKEYESLSADIIGKTEKSTKEAFTIMIKKKRLKQLILTVFTCVLSCVLLSGLWTFLNHACVFEQKDIKVERVYRYTGVDGEKKFYVDYYCPPARSMRTEFREEDGVTVCETTLRAPFILPDKGDYNWNDTVIISAESNLDCTAPAEKLIFSGVTVWTKEANNDSEIPAYVYANDIYENGNQDDNSDSDTCSWYTDINTVTLEHAKYGRLTWTRDGKLIEGSPEMEKEIIELYK